MIVFGIDPGSRKTGWGAVRVTGSELVCLGFGVIAVPESEPLASRLAQIFRNLCEVLERHRPDVVFLESVFHNKNVRSALVLGQARGAALVAAHMTGAEIDELAPAAVKSSVAGGGRADKTQVKHMVKVLLGLSTLPPADAADALAIAIAGATRVRWRDRVMSAPVAPVRPEGKG